MAKKAAKTLASNNTSRLNQTLVATAAIHGLFWLFRALIFRSSFTRKSLVLYIIFSGPQLLINFWFEKIARPTYIDGAVKRAGEDLEAKGLTEYMWDVTYWTYGCLILASLLGDSAWWAWSVVPLYSAYSVWTTYTGMRGGFTDAAGVPQPGAAGAGGTSKRQAKMEKRGGQKVAYR